LGINFNLLWPGFAGISPIERFIVNEFHLFKQLGGVSFAAFIISLKLLHETDLLIGKLFLNGILKTY
jgi:hypothetical protein